jgi:hypothetical protein
MRLIPAPITTTSEVPSLRRLVDRFITTISRVWRSSGRGRVGDHVHPAKGAAMAKVISILFISADGVAEIDPVWHFPYFDENMGRAVGEDYAAADVLLLGRVTYDSFAGACPIGRPPAGRTRRTRRSWATPGRSSSPGSRSSSPGGSPSCSRGN